MQPTATLLPHPPSQINNAGVFVDKYDASCDGLDAMWVTNYLSHYLLTDMLLPALQAAAPSRIVHVSSEAAWISPLDLDLLPPTPYFSKVGGKTASCRRVSSCAAAARRCVG